MMTHIYNVANAQLDRPSTVTIGVFDGVHRGHHYLIRELVEEAHAQDRLAVVLTFFPHPDVVLRGLEGRYYLTTADQKAELLMRLGVDYVVTHPFDDAVRHVRAADFVAQLRHHLRMERLWVGADFALGYQREGNAVFLRQQGERDGFSVQEIDLVSMGGEAVSSTAIREALLAGEVEQARAWLGRGYSLVGQVVRGDGRGRRIGFPTANITVWEQQVIPANGVYAGWAWVDNERIMAVTNVGVRPTFNGHSVTVEAHLLDFDRDLYGLPLEISFETRLRAEKKFNGVGELIAQIGADAAVGRAYLQGQR